MTIDKPSERDALSIAADFWGRSAHEARRFSTGIGHWVYEVRGGADDKTVVVRLGKADQADDFAGALHWSTTLRPLGVPLPQLLGRGTFNGFPYLVLERLPGDDLGAVYSSLTTVQKRSIASEVQRIQTIVAGLPHAAGYGYARLPQGPFMPTWAAVVGQSIARSRSRIEAAGLIDSRNVELVEAGARSFSSYFSRVTPTPFLDDATTKNVLVSGGALSGLVDVDWLCFGDPWLTVALTRTSLLSSGFDLVYTDHWCELLMPTAEQRAALHFYTALFCLDFMSEAGHEFNRGSEGIAPSFVSPMEALLRSNLEAARRLLG